METATSTATSSGRRFGDRIEGGLLRCMRPLPLFGPFDAVDGDVGYGPGGGIAGEYPNGQTICSPICSIDTSGCAQGTPLTTLFFLLV